MRTWLSCIGWMVDTEENDRRKDMGLDPAPAGEQPCVIDLRTVECYYRTELKATKIECVGVDTVGAAYDLKMSFAEFDALFQAFLVEQENGIYATRRGHDDH